MQDLQPASRVLREYTQNPATASADLYQQVWKPRQYLEQYYSGATVSDDEQAVFAQLAKWFDQGGRQFKRGLDFGCGPTIHHAAALVPYVQELHLADYLPDNLEEIRRWLRDDSDAHVWDVYLSGALTHDEAAEGGGNG